MGMCCIHGTFLHALNFYKTGERQTHAVALLKHLFKGAIGDKIQEVRLCYDVACKFDKAVKRTGTNAILPVDMAKRLCSRINRFHIYGHQYSCHVLYNLLHTVGWGLMNGEEIERLWASLRHLIRAGRVCTGPRKAQRVDAGILHLARASRETMGKNLARRLENSRQVTIKYQPVIDKLVGSMLPSGIIISEAYLEHQGTLQYDHYFDPSGGTDTGRPETKKARKAQRDIVQILVNSAIEMSDVERCTRSLRNSKHFLDALKARSKKLDGAVKRYNTQIDALKGPQETRLVRPLDVKVLRDQGLNTDALWDLDRETALDDWAIYPQVRMGIDATARVMRAHEERDRCAIHLSRHLKWVVSSANNIIDYIQFAGTALGADRARELNAMLLHRQKIGNDILSAKLTLVDNDKKLLFDAMRRMETVLPSAGSLSHNDVPASTELESDSEEEDEDLGEGLMNLPDDTDSEVGDDPDDEDGEDADGANEPEADA